MLRRLCVVAVMLCRPLGAISAQETPEAAAQAFGEAIIANDWATAARLMHPQALRQLRDLFQPLIDAPGAEQMGAQLFGLQSNAELAATADTTLFASFLRTIISQEAGLTDVFRNATFTPLGHVNAGADTVLVVSRMDLTIEGIAIRQFEVMPFVRADGRWWGLLKADFTNMAAMLKQSLGRRS